MKVEYVEEVNMQRLHRYHDNVHFIGKQYMCVQQVVTQYLLHSNPGLAYVLEDAALAYVLCGMRKDMCA
jgi:hypothetical protein